MGTTTDTAMPSAEPMRVTIELPPRIARDYQRLTDMGVFLSLEDGIRHAVVQSWRFEQASYHSIRFDLSKDDEDETSAREATRDGSPDSEPSTKA